MDSDGANATAPKQSWKTSVSQTGEFVRKASVFRRWIGDASFPAEKGRYHLYVSLACPWAHRTLITRCLKGLVGVISCTVVDWRLGERGWAFTDKVPGCSLDVVNNYSYLSEVYTLADGSYRGNITVPVLWDKKGRTIVNNESSEIIRMLNSSFNAFCETEEQRSLDLYPEALRTQIDDTNSWVYEGINNGVYRAGFATTQEAYEEAAKNVFVNLDRAEAILATRRFLVGDRLTEADVRLFTTLVRFDMVYVGHFKCNTRRLVDYPNLWAYTRDIYQTGGIGETVDADHIKKHYYNSHRQINPHGIVPIGPELDFSLPHGRDKRQ